MKKTFITLAVILTCLGTAAQDFSRSEFSINVGGGASSFQNDPTQGKDRWNWTGTAGLGYHFFFSPHWGIGTGANFVLYNGGISIDNYNQKQATTNVATGNAFDFLVSSSNYKESQQAMMVTIPLMLQYQGTSETAFYAALGGKVGIPVSAKSQPKGNFTTKGYFPNLNVTYENLPDYGFVTDQAFPEDKTDIRLKTAFMASAELGVKWSLSDKISLYTGIYADYTFNNILDKESVAGSTNLVVYQLGTPALFAYNTATNSYAKQMKPLAGGITLRLAFKTGASSPTMEQRVDILTKRADAERAERLAKEREEKRLAAEAKAKADEEAARQRAEEEAEANRLAQEKFDAEQAIASEREARRIIEKPIEDFALSQIALTSSQKTELDEKIMLLQQHPDFEIYIYGHTCNIGSLATNDKIGLRRAEVAKSYIIDRGIDPNRIIATVSKYYSEPLVPNSSEENRARNRRVEIIVK